jgi:methylated-DNA-protein-cysteine methyltransferase-like protein
MPVLKSEYERARDSNIKRNAALLAALGLDEPPLPTAEAPHAQSGAKRRRDPSAAPPAREQRSVQTRSCGSAVSEQSGGEPPAAAETAQEHSRGARMRPRPLTLADSARAAGSSGDFAWRVLQVVQAIPKGSVAAYGQCAAYAGSPNGARQVGKLLALGLAAGGDDVPWQRVINASGGISLPPNAGGARQRELLQAEGVAFGSSNKVGAEFFWDPSAKAIARLFEKNDP